MRLKELNVLGLIPKHDEVKVGDLMIMIENITLRNGTEALSLPLTRRSLDYILGCLQDQELINIFLSKTKPPRKFVVLTDMGRNHLKKVLPKERDLFDNSITESLKE
ncbi:MAG: hypothetical protein ACTSRE_13245 [Promethearchaeota archaeon]